MDALDFYGKKDRKTNAHMPDASFTSKSNRGKHMIAGAKVPGPGEYFPEKADKILRKGNGMEKKAMAWSAATTMPKKQALNTKQPSPGPGWYDLGSTGNIHEGGAGSSFKSNTKRFGSGGKAKPPGPAYYNVCVPTSKSRTFHLNIDNKWI